MDLSTFIDQIGDETAAKLFGVKRRTAQSWRLRDRSPRPEQVKKIIRASKGRLTYEDIYGSPKE